ncbi:MAG: family 43 glycosylhydrolase [Eubacterium sp.]|nr:family 43 glycosylhydrolase [Eubacterium sp.]
MHLALREEGKFHALNHNSGVLFAKATENEDGSLNAKSIRNPYLFVMRDGTYGVLAVRVDGDGGEDVESTGKAIFFTSHDLLEYKEEGLLPLCEGAVDRVVCSYDPGKEMYEISWCQSDKQWYRAELKHIECMDKRITGVKVDELILPAVETEIEGAVAGNVISIPDETAKRLQQKLLPPRHIKTEVPEEVQAASREQLELVWARALYSDGTEALKRVDWNMDSIDWSRPGVYEVEGKLHQDHFPFPMAEDRADPCITYWNGKYYFIATNDADKNHTLYVREADTIPGLVEAKEHLILDSDTYDYVGNLLWAPEFHEIKGELYIFLALTPEEFFGEESHIMKLKEGGNPSRKEDWSEPKRVVRSDGSQLCEAGKTITLDMTCFFWEGDYYVVWSQRQFLPRDLGAWLYIAKLNADEPWKLLSEPVLLSKPEYGWANNHTFVDEGPFALPQEERLILTFSSAAVDTSYVVGIMTIDRDKDLLDPKNWKKGNYPIMTSRSVEGEFGTGHNAYVVDEYGDVWNSYHARPGIHGERSSGIRRVHFDIDGLPVLDLVEEQDVSEEFSRVRTKVVVG